MEENKIIQFFSQHWSKLLLGMLAVACVFAWTERFYKSHKSQDKQDFVVVGRIYEQFQKGETLPSESIETAEKILHRHPELHPKYDSMLALTFFSQAKTPKALEYAKSLMTHTQKQLPELYQLYAQNSLLISEENLSAAFVSALALDEQLTGQSGYETLTAMNLLRLLFLADSLGYENDKQIFWEKLEKHPHFAVIDSIFQEGSLSLNDYFRASH